MGQMPIRGQEFFGHFKYELFDTQKVTEVYLKRNKVIHQCS